MKTLLLIAIIILTPTVANAWGVYRGYQARVFYYNPWASSGPFIAGAGHPSSPQYGRGYGWRYRGRGGYVPYGGRDIDRTLHRMRVEDSLQDISHSLQNIELQQSWDR